MNIKIIIGLIATIIGLAWMVISAILPLQVEPIGYTHTGKELFNEQDFADFKIELASDDIKNLQLDIINVDYPILVDYYFTTSFGYKIFNEDIEPIPNNNLLILMFICVPFIAGGGITIINEVNK